MAISRLNHMLESGSQKTAAIHACAHPRSRFVSYAFAVALWLGRYGWDVSATS